MWAFGYSGCGCEALLWRSSKWKIKVTIQIVGTSGQGDGSSSKGSYLCLHKAFASLWPYSLSWVPKTNSNPLWYELGAWNIHREVTDASFCTCFKWTKGVLVETLKLI
jgi:hypothetical protein